MPEGICFERGLEVRCEVLAPSTSTQHGQRGRFPRLPFQQLLTSGRGENAWSRGGSSTGACTSNLGMLTALGGARSWVSM